MSRDPDALAWTVADAVLEQGHAVRMRVRGRSMRPLIRDQDVVRIAPVAARALRYGDLVLTASGPEAATAVRVIHRVVGRYRTPEGLLLITRGDANDHRDRPVPEAGVLGRVVCVERGAWRIELDRPAGRALSALAAVFSGALPGVGAAIEGIRWRARRVILLGMRGNRQDAKGNTG